MIGLFRHEAPITRRTRLGARIPPIAVLALLTSCSQQDAQLTAVVERADYEYGISVEGVLRAVETTVVSAPTQLERPARIAWLIEDGTRVIKGDLIASFDPTEMSNLLDDGRSDLVRVRHRIEENDAKARSRREELETTREVSALEAEVAARYEKQDEEVFSRVEIIESRIDGQLAEERKKHATEMASVVGRLQLSESELLEIERRKVGLDVTRAEGALEALEVRAPHDGIASLARDWSGEPLRVGAQVWRGQAIAEIPDLARLEAELFVLEADASALAVGRSASVYLESQAPLTLAGTIKSVEAVAKPRFRGSPVQYVGVAVELDDVSQEIRELMKPGQRVMAHLDLDQRKNVLQLPRQAVFLEGGATWVRVQSSDTQRIERRQIEVETQSLSRVVISSGLEEGEVVLLEGPREGENRGQDEEATEIDSSSGRGATG